MKAILYSMILFGVIELAHAFTMSGDVVLSGTDPDFVGVNGVEISLSDTSGQFLSSDVSKSGGSFGILTNGNFSFSNSPSEGILEVLGTPTGFKVLRFDPDIGAFFPDPPFGSVYQYTNNSPFLDSIVLRLIVEGQLADDITASWWCGEDSLCITYDGSISFELSKRVNTFLDTDLDASTGWQGWGQGMDFLLQDNNLFAYSGSGSDWSWTFIKEVWLRDDQRTGNSELCFARSDIGNPDAFRWIYYGDNSGITIPPIPDDVENVNATILSDTFPDGAPALFECEPSGGPGGSGDIPLNDITWWSNSTSICGTYWLNDEPSVSLGSPWNLFLDTDLDANTGWSTFGMGADFLVQGSRVFTYSGNGSWEWTEVANAWVNTDRQNGSGGQEIEICFPSSVIGDPGSFRYIFYGDVSPTPEVFPSSSQPATFVR